MQYLTAIKLIVLAASINVAVSAQDNSIVIDIFEPEKTLFSGLDTALRLNVNVSEDYTDLLVSFGLKEISLEVSRDENIEYMETYVPDTYLLNETIDILSAGESYLISKNIPIDAAVEPGTYMLVATVEQLTKLDPAVSGGEILEETENPSVILAYQFAEGYYEVEVPTLPSLSLAYTRLKGTDGYTLTLSDLPKYIRVDVQVGSKIKDIFDPVDVRFYLVTPYANRIPLNLVNYLEDSLEIKPSWLIESSCVECPSLSQNNTLGNLINLELKPEYLESVVAGDVLYIQAELDPDQTIDEWNDDRSDNSISLPVYIFE